MVEDMVIVGEVVTGDDVDARIFLNLPVVLSETLSLGKKLAL